MDIFNTLNVSVLNSTFHSNQVTNLNDPFHGDSAGLSIGYHFIHELHQDSNIIISGCTFRDNTDVIPQILINQDIEQLFQNHLYPARGGGTSIIITEDYISVTVVIKDCLYERNTAKTVGGGLYIVIDGLNTNHSVMISGCQFVNNTSSVGGGAVIGFLINNLRDIPSMVEFTDCLFADNRAQFAGGMAMLETHFSGTGSFLRITSSNFTNNTVEKEGSAIVFGSLLSVHSQQMVRFSVVTDW